MGFYDDGALTDELDAIARHESANYTLLTEEGQGHLIDKDHPELGYEKGGGPFQMSPSTLAYLVNKYPKRLGKYSKVVADFPKNPDAVTNALATDKQLALDSAKAYAGELIRGGANTPDKFFYAWNHGHAPMGDATDDPYVKLVMPHYEDIKAGKRLPAIPVGTTAGQDAGDDDAYNALFAKYTGDDASRLLTEARNAGYNAKQAEQALLHNAHKAILNGADPHVLNGAIGLSDPELAKLPPQQQIQKLREQISGVKNDSTLDSSGAPESFPGANILESILRKVGKAGSTVQNVGEVAYKLTGADYNPLMNNPITAARNIKGALDTGLQKVGLQAPPKPQQTQQKPSIFDPVVNAVGKYGSQLTPGAPIPGMGESFANMTRSGISNLTFGVAEPTPPTPEQNAAHLRAFGEMDPIFRQSVEPEVGATAGAVGMEGAMKGFGKLAGPSITRVEGVPPVDQTAVARRMGVNFDANGKELPGSIAPQFSQRVSPFFTDTRVPGEMGVDTSANPLMEQFPQQAEPRPDVYVNPQRLPKSRFYNQNKMPPAFSARGGASAADVAAQFPDLGGEKPDYSQRDVDALFRDAGEPGVRPNIGDYQGYKRVQPLQKKPVVGPETPTPAEGAPTETAQPTTEAKSSAARAKFDAAIASIKAAKNEFHLHNALQKHADALAAASSDPELARQLGEALDAHETPFEKRATYGPNKLKISTDEELLLKSMPNTYERLQYLREAGAFKKGGLLDRLKSEKGSIRVLPDYIADRFAKTKAGLTPPGADPNAVAPYDKAAADAAGIDNLHNMPGEPRGVLPRLLERFRNIGGEAHNLDQLANENPEMYRQILNRGYDYGTTPFRDLLTRLMQERGAVNLPGRDIPENQSLSKFEPVDPNLRKDVQNPPYSLGMSIENYDRGGEYLSPKAQTREVVPGNELDRTEQLRQKYDLGHPYSGHYASGFAARQELYPEMGLGWSAAYPSPEEPTRTYYHPNGRDGATPLPSDQRIAAPDVSGMHMPSDPVGPAEGIIPENRFGQRLDPRLMEQRLQQGLKDIRRPGTRTADRKALTQPTEEALSPKDVVAKPSSEGTLYANPIKALLNKANQSLGAESGLMSKSSILRKLAGTDATQQAFENAKADYRGKLAGYTMLDLPKEIDRLRSTGMKPEDIAKEAKVRYRGFEKQLRTQLVQTAQKLHPDWPLEKILNHAAIFDDVQNSFDRVASKTAQLIKNVKVLGSAGAYVNNPIGNVVFAALDGKVNPIEFGKSVNDIAQWETQSKLSPILERAIRNGLFGGEQFHGPDIVNKLQSEARTAKGGATAALETGRKVLKGGFTGMGKLMSGPDAIAKLHAFRENLLDGMSDRDAALKARQAFPDYEDLGAFGNSMRRSAVGRVFTPFMAFPTSSARIMLRQALRNPANAMAVLGAGYAMYNRGPLMYLDPKEVEAARAKLGVQGSIWHKFLIPYGKDNQGNIKFVDLTYAPPLMDYLSNGAYDPSKSFGENAAAFFSKDVNKLINPIYNEQRGPQQFLPSMLTRGRQLVTGEKVKTELGQDPHMSIGRMANVNTITADDSAKQAGDDYLHRKEDAVIAKASKMFGNATTDSQKEDAAKLREEGLARIKAYKARRQQEIDQK